MSFLEEFYEFLLGMGVLGGVGELRFWICCSLKFGVGVWLFLVSLLKWFLLVRVFSILLVLGFCEGFIVRSCFNSWYSFEGRFGFKCFLFLNFC